jgi:hypothetical protein
VRLSGAVEGAEAMRGRRAAVNLAEMAARARACVCVNVCVRVFVCVNVCVRA